MTTDITPFDQIVPCGIRDREVGSIKGLLKENFLSNGCRKEDNNQTDDSNLIDTTYKSLVREFGEVFQVDLSHISVQRGVHKSLTIGKM